MYSMYTVAGNPCRQRARLYTLYSICILVWSQSYYTSKFGSVQYYRIVLLLLLVPWSHVGLQRVEYHRTGVLPGQKYHTIVPGTGSSNRHHFVGTICVLHQDTFISQVFYHGCKIVKRTVELSCNFSVGRPSVQSAPAPMRRYNSLTKAFFTFRLLTPPAPPRPINGTELVRVNLIHRSRHEFNDIKGIFSKHILTKAGFRSCLRKTNQSL
jgi:hypothetical protein